METFARASEARTCTLCNTIHPNFCLAIQLVSQTSETAAWKTLVHLAVDNAAVPRLEWQEKQLLRSLLLQKHSIGPYMAQAIRVDPQRIVKPKLKLGKKGAKRAKWGVGLSCPRRGFLASTSCRPVVPSTCIHKRCLVAVRDVSFGKNPFGVFSPQFQPWIPCCLDQMLFLHLPCRSWQYWP